MSDRLNHIKELISLLPDTPGVYQYLDKEGKIIYIGKAKNLKRRVSSYFNKVHDSVKTNVLVKNIHDLNYIVVKTEEDALHLENNLIKEYQPRYNVLLKDGKTYPWITVRNEHFPRIFLTRNVTKDGSRYFGPYANLHIAKTMIELIRSLYPIRTCKHALTPENIARHKFKVCLEYHIKRCKGACEGLQNEDEYNNNISHIRQILNGNTQQLCKHLLDEMQSLAADLKFEEAQIVKEKYLLLEKYHAKSVIVSTILDNIDIFSYEEDDSAAFINFMHLRNGVITQSYTIEYRKRLEEEKENILALGITELRTRFESTAREIVIPFAIDIEFEKATLTIPQRGDRHKLLEMSQQNAKQYKVDRLKQAEKINPEQRSTRILTRLQKDFNLDALPIHIECFDNSNTQGTNPVASCVVFKKAKPAKKDYRHFNIKTVIGPDDFASMKEIVFRRYKRLLDEKQALPQLVVVDGGKGQLSAAVESLEALGLQNKVPIVGIAKRLEEIYFPHDPIPLYLDKNSESLKLIQQMRDEAHRFGITHHRKKRSKSQIASIFDAIPGIGNKTMEILLKQYKSLKRIKEASDSEIKALIGNAKGVIVVEHLKKME